MNLPRPWPCEQPTADTINPGTRVVLVNRLIVANTCCISLFSIKTKHKSLGPKQDSSSDKPIFQKTMRRSIDCRPHAPLSKLDFDMNEQFLQSIVTVGGILTSRNRTLLILRLAVLAIGGQVLASEKPTPRIDMTAFEFQTMSSEQQAELMSNFVEILSEVEATPRLNFPMKHAGTKRDIPFCLHDGWIFNATADKHCLFEILNKGCGDSKVRCAPWTGSQECVPLAGKSALATCLNPNPNNPAPEPFSNREDAATFILLWNIVGDQCQTLDIKNRTKCQNLMAIANRHRSGMRAEGLNESLKRFTLRGKRLNSKKEALNLLGTFISRPASASAICSYNSQANTFTKANGDKIRFLFGRHADPQSINDFFLQIFSSQTAPEKRVATINSYFALPATQATLKDLHQQAQELKILSGTRWAGTEYTPAELSPTSLTEHREERKILIQILRNSGVPDSQINDIMLLHYEPVLDQELAKSDSSQSIDFVGAEDRDLKGQFHELAKNVFSDDLQQFAEEKRLSALSAQAFQQLYVSSLINNHAPDVAERESVLNTIHDPETKIAMNSSFKALYDLIAVKIARDKLAVSRFLGHSGSGVVLYGGDHERGFIEQLNEYCKIKSDAADTQISGAIPKNNEAHITH